MIQSFIAEMGPWSWWIGGLILLAAEILAPGIFLLWVGLAAIVVGLLSFALWGSPVWGWQIQFLIFAILSVVFALLGKRFMAGNRVQSDQPMLNRRIERLIGRTATLEEPIENGHGRIPIDDTLWVVRGPDLPQGTRVRVTSIIEGELSVEQASPEA